MKTGTTTRTGNKVFLLWGFLLWLAATLVFHFFGGLLIDVEKPLITGICFIAAIPLIWGCMTPLYSMVRLSPLERLVPAACTALPGMLLDVVSLPFHRFVFPGISDSSMPLLAAWLLWAYALIILTGLRTKGHSA
ncbi:DUF5367 family protein [Paenibacillus macerans]|uniref:Putative membrane protein n=1 Tax=Paenibacillus macerans TaxID=44252 RepID=A0A090XFN5_PAEMA|nr:DUF5367 family protein [Paenibacillus macerans]KFM83739.1 putative membrane protein [Paenibacillus macerans]MBS5910300.1 DUF5367 family protein [Paenibacillus macerans]MCY7559639.1 DUF5367 domain-containing protein [Paenibacillus macerans]MDU5948821.1 DUF5367 family protein [Paenibacillus macerans]MEC0135656.1 DUF5367 family protein [Paenibacillus macerans]